MAKSTSELRSARPAANRPEMKSYGTTALGLVGRLDELRQLYRSKRASGSPRVARLIAEMRTVEEEIRGYSGLALQGLDVLDVGPGQHQGYMAWLAARNRVVGIDLDLAPHGLHPGQYYRLWRANGLMRVAKTVGRKTLGFDRRFRAEFARQMGLPGFPKLDLRAMNAQKMSFPDESFDLVYSRAVFEHIRDPEQAFCEIRRVLRPGGCVHVTLHLYTSDSGCHDVRILTGHREGLPMWSHLREQYRSRVRENSYLNRLRLPQWREIIDRALPGAEIALRPDSNPRIRGLLDEVRALGELGDHSDEELLTVAVRALWVKRPKSNA